MGLVKAQRSEKRTRGWLQRKLLHEGVLLVEARSVEQRVVVAALGSSMKENAMWHVPHRMLRGLILVINARNSQLYYVEQKEKLKP